MTKKTLTIRAPEEREDAPRLQKKGRGWAIAESRLDAIHETAREMRRDPSPAHAALAAELAKEELGKFKPKSLAVIGSAIANFACQPLKLVVMISESDVPAEIAQRRDRSLGEVGLAVVRLDAGQVLADPAAAAREVVAAMKARYEEQRAARSAAPRSSGPRGYAPRSAAPRSTAPRRAGPQR
jgi:very-short-patch-repair endonuclease